MTHVINKILTVPETIGDRTKFYPVANEWVALPELSEDGELWGFNILNERSKGMVEIKGGEQAFLTPQIGLDGVNVDVHAARWSRLDDWIPKFEIEHNKVAFSGTVVCPNGFKGFVYILDVTNDDSVTHCCDLGWLGNWENTFFTVYRSRLSTGNNIGWYNRWTRTLSFEHRGGLPVLGWALGLSEPLAELDWQLDGGQSEDESCSHSGQALSFEVSKSIEVAPNSIYKLALFVAVNSEADGASTGVVDLQRRGYRKLEAEHRQWLQNRKTLTNNESNLARICNLNGFFNYFFATGRCLDTENLVLMTTRSPRYYVSAAFWARDAYLWSFPGLLSVDRALARETLLLGSTTYWKNLAEHSLYIDGTQLYPGFELDELCSLIVALGKYLGETSDWMIVEEMGLDFFDNFLEVLEGWKGSNGLYKTFLSPTDDPIKYPYLTYNNALVWKSFTILAEIYAYFSSDSRSILLKMKADELKNTIERLCIAVGPMGKMYAWSVGESGECELLDQPPGSLQLLEYYGYCTAENEVYRNTVAWIHSVDNPHYYGVGPFAAPYCEHSPFPWVLSICYELINGNREKALKQLSEATLDNGIACETIDPDTGWVKTGAAFATCAGFLTYSLALALQVAE